MSLQGFYTTKGLALADYPRLTATEKDTVREHIRQS